MLAATKLESPRFEEIKSIVINGVAYVPVSKDAGVLRIGSGRLIELFAGTTESLTLKEKHPPV